MWPPDGAASCVSGMSQCSRHHYPVGVRPAPVRTILLIPSEAIGRTIAFCCRQDVLFCELSLMTLLRKKRRKGVETRCGNSDGRGAIS
jgi:hypothetical protein